MMKIFTVKLLMILLISANAVLADEWLCDENNSGKIGCHDNEAGYIFNDLPDAGCRVRPFVGGIACKKRDFGIFYKNSPGSVKYRNQWGYTEALNCHYSLSSRYDFVCR